MIESGLELLEAWSILGELAGRATEVQTRKAARALIQELINQTEKYLDVLSFFEQTADPITIAQRALVWSATDKRPLLNAPASPKDRYSNRLARRRENLPRALSILGKLASR